ncbi:hypothetical protein VI817_004414 [Penicillium citrinum]|nr:hypothetical protein VI817_004414 [Penicillium citrinum]
MSMFKSLSGFFTGPSSPEEISAAKSKAEALIKENGVVFSKSYCPYFATTKRSLNTLGANYVLLELNEIGMLSCLRIMI